MSDQDLLAVQFEQHRPHLRAVALRLLGASGRADDAVQEAWLRLARSDAADIRNLRGWLTAVVARLCLDVLRSGALTHETPTDVPPETSTPDIDPATEVEVAEAVSEALLVVLDRLSPAERIAFVLHESFGIPYADIARVLERSAAATKQLASRARDKVRGTSPVRGGKDEATQRHVVEAFLRAARGGDLASLVAVLHPDVAVVPDRAAISMGAPAATVGAEAVATLFSGRALGAEVATVDGTTGMAWVVAGSVKVAWNFYVADNRVVHIDMHADPTELSRLGVATPETS